MSAPPVYPWQRRAWERIEALRAAGRVPHALLVTGPGGTGERAFAECVVAAMLCAADGDAVPCGACAACRELAAGTHPDAVVIEPEQAGKAIGIDRIRALTDRLTLTGTGRGKAAVVDPADAMTLQAANSLLKTLEEPPGDALLLLVSSRPARLPATVRSRCQRIGFGIPSREPALAWLRAQDEVDDAEAWLDRAGGAPLAAAELARAGVDASGLVEPLLQALETGRVEPESAASGADTPLATSVPLLAAAVGDMIRLRMVAQPRLRLPSWRDRLARAAAGVDVRALFDYLDVLNRSLPAPSSALRADIQWRGLLADAAATVRPGQR